MTSNRTTTSLAARLTLAIASVLVVAGCVADSEEKSTQEIAQSQPRYATYHCGDSGDMSIENRTNSVTIVDVEGDNISLPASPPTQNNRYGEGGYALVLEGPEALWMKAGREPLNCKR
ncbi:hypothetical protein [Aquamicrobium sp. LC103]|uniref:hypothetical protein n=1 Tax=Aquamicrobium sp. LC103 TaxID=1120658 RepID=UPI00069AE720|nr:hypothetical protein [Aquamicrobium sp. LC103]TKT82835.1 hypothetical protein XW59_002410 [Aquamicrobium sp. LC103]